MANTVNKQYTLLMPITNPSEDLDALLVDEEMTVSAAFAELAKQYLEASHYFSDISKKTVNLNADMYICTDEGSISFTLDDGASEATLEELETEGYVSMSVVDFVVPSLDDEDDESSEEDDYDDEDDYGDLDSFDDEDDSEDFAGDFLRG